MEYNLTLTDVETNTVINALAEMPYKVSKALIDKIILQAQSQIQPPDNAKEL